MKIKGYRWVLLCLGMFWSTLLLADGLTISDPSILNKPLLISPYCTAFEDSQNHVTIDEILNENIHFSPLGKFKPLCARSVFWITFEIQNSSANDLDLNLFYRALTFVELYELSNDTIIKTHRAGLFRPKSAISPGDDYNHFSIHLKSGDKNRYFLKINHTKGYVPNLIFSLQNHSSFLGNYSWIERIDFLLFGAFLVFLLYSILIFLFTRYVPYFWLSVYILGMSFYGFTMSGHILDFFPNYPEFIWRLNILFTCISGVGGMMLISKFFNLKELDKLCYTLLNIFIGLQIFQFISGQFIIEYSHNYRVMTLLSILISSLFIPLIIYIPYKVWSKLAPPQKMFSISIYLYSVFLLVGLLLLLVVKEKSIQVVSYLNNLSGIVGIIFFIIAIGEQMHNNEVERNLFLVELNGLKNEQNKILEELVEKRTSELSRVNEELVRQKDTLSIRNKRIELLLRELHHRVKNNLQLISSFYELRRNDPIKKDLSLIIQEGQNRIKVMALVHNMLYQGNDSDTIELSSFINQIAAHLETIFNANKLITMRIVCPTLKFDMDTVMPLGLIINELLTNEYKHLIFENEPLIVNVTIVPAKENSYILTVSDNGKKIKEQIIPEKNQSFGLHMIYLLSKQLNGNFTYKFDGMNRFIVNFMNTEGLRQIP